MTWAWKELEGRTVGEYPLLRFLGGGETGAVFQTELREPGVQKAAIKLIPANHHDAEYHFGQWSAAAGLSHPHLLRIFHTGRGQLDGDELLYVVTEYAEEDLAQVLAGRAITAPEAREMLEPALDALTYIHSQGLVHGHVKPANIMAVDDRLKLSSDGLSPAGAPCAGTAGVYDAPEITGRGMTPAADVWSIGVTLFQALTQRLPVWEAPGREKPVMPEILPSPYREIASRCLERDPERRWTVAEIAARLRSASPAAIEERAPVARPLSTRWRLALPAAALGVLLAALVARPLLFHRHTEPAPAPVLDQASRPPQATPQASRVARGEVAHEVLPEVHPSARNTIRGKIKISVRVHVDPSGNVTESKLATSGPSRYFAEQALQAARRWKFVPPAMDGQETASQWMLRFEFTRSGTRAFPSRVAPR